MSIRAARTVLLALALLPAGAGCSPPAPARVEAPADTTAGEIGFELAGAGGAALVVPVFVNGQGPFDFALDTGATFTCIDRALAERLSLSQSRGSSGIGASAQGAGRIRLLRVDSLRVGSARGEDLLACELDLAHTSRLGIEIDGLLGLNFLKPFRVTLDFQRQVLRLQPAAD